VSDDPERRDEGMAGRIVLVIDADLPAVARQACADVAARLADQVRMPVTVAASPVSRLDTLEDSLRLDATTHRREFAPTPLGDAAPMTSAPFLWRPDGRPDWRGMWTTFCELALYGGPPQRGPESPLRVPAGATTSSDAEMLAEMRRGIWETTGLYAEPAAPGWLSVTCESPTMAAWMCAAIILENVGARLDDDRLLLPAGPGFGLKDEVKSIITVVAKTHHYWQAHVADAGRVAPDLERG
jgi:sirohydrochlorin cobaltochelatase